MATAAVIMLPSAHQARLRGTPDLVTIELVKCRDQWGSLKPWAIPIVQRANSYTENLSADRVLIAGIARDLRAIVRRLPYPDGGELTLAGGQLAYAAPFSGKPLFGRERVADVTELAREIEAAAEARLQASLTAHQRAEIAWKREVATFHARVARGENPVWPVWPGVEPPPPPPVEPLSLAQAEAALAEAIRAFYDAHRACWRAVRASTGLGKSTLVILLWAELARRRRTEGETVGALLYTVPTLRLAERLQEKCIAAGIDAKVWRGRGAEDPSLPGATMCQDLEATKDALKIGLTIQDACCLNTKTGRCCPFLPTCAYQDQRKHTPTVWIAAHEILFLEQEALGDFEAVIIDESFHQTAMRGQKDRGVTLDQIAAGNPLPPPNRRSDDGANDLQAARGKLARALRRQEGKHAGLERRHLAAEGLTAKDCAHAYRLEWRFKQKIDLYLYPGMAPSIRRQVAADFADEVGLHWRLTRLWKDAEELLLDPDVNAVSGRIILDDKQTDEGIARVVRSRGIKPIADKWATTKTLIMDATLPDLPILKASFPKVEIVADIACTAPHASVEQVMGAPTSAKKLGIGKDKSGEPILLNPEGNRNIREARLAILRTVLDFGRPKTLVVAQKAAAGWFRPRLPKSIAVEHYNNVEGIDDYKNVRLLIAIGRTLPNVYAVEADAGAISGREAIKTELNPTTSSRWFDQTTREIQLKDGSTQPVKADLHPDPIAEAVRFQICEAEVIQAIGRTRAIRRGPNDPLDIVILNDLALPGIAVDRVTQWQTPGLDVDMVAEGIEIESPSDMAKCWPETWKNEKAAKHWRSRGKRSLTPIETFLPATGRYQYPGERQKWRHFRYDPNVIPDPAAWLEAKLGELARVETEPGQAKASVA